MTKTTFISDHYQKIQAELHANNPRYGIASIGYAPEVDQIIELEGFNELLDYGCGKCNLVKHLRTPRSLRVHLYDPAIEQYREPPNPCRFVCCIDVLEHVEPEYLNNVLADLQRVVSYLGFFTVHTGPAKKVLPDGRNAHLIQKDAGWWTFKLKKYFQLSDLTPRNNGFSVLVHPLGKR